MEEALFKKSFYAVWQQMLEQATRDVQQLDRRLFNDAALGQHLQRIAKKHDVQIAQFEGEMTAKRRTEQKRRQDMWGDARTVEVTLLEVNIPFVGEAESLRIAPSTMTLLNQRATIGRNSLTIAVADDDRAESEVQDFKNTVEGNLRILRTEYERAKPQMEQTIQRAASQRKAQIDAEDARDKGRSFRIIN
ncbi:hypothetical protein [Bradyrhizobium sp. SEMIA]|uniref:hypothetical protein n=1 Tax=Bradyrhizobium sp. SEMIA TaxID=2597515 RepID=UPI0018A38838|nr:hypothetical protein [Bradyrhizobium sp. SEMIA]QOG21732.1 hypothetical protein FOM02_35000 [Bradyrhizobium sp. SEMIA]